MMHESLCNQKTFDFVFFSHAKDLRNYLYYKFGDLETAEDIVQESFIKLWVNCAKVAFQKSKSYLFTIATNLFIDKKRHEKVVIQFKNKIQNHIEHESPDFILQEKEFMLKIQSTIGNLPDKQREVFLLNRIDKKTYKEIAELINISVKAVEKRMHKALITVRKEIGDI
jgi:RNA polymerase sigma-70 factor (family 1)